MKSKNRFSLNQAGMTLMEIMIVLAILGGLMAVLGSTVAGKLQKSRLSQAKIQMKEIEKQLEIYNSDCGSYPTTEQGLAALTKSPGADACPNWGPEPYVKSEKNLKDPWGSEFIYESDGTSIGAMKSLGKDKKEGGDGYDADIVLE
jgi:general secretion pathway protein G